jgi:hypothetical protein
MMAKRAPISFAAVKATKAIQAEPAPKAKAKAETPPGAGRGRPVKHKDPQTGERVKAVSLTLRLDPDLYTQLADLAHAEKIKSRTHGDGSAVSMNDLLIDAVRDLIAKRASRG